MRWWRRLRCSHGTPTKSWIDDVSHSAWLCGLPCPMWVCNHCKKTWIGKRCCQ